MHRIGWNKWLCWAREKATIFGLSVFIVYWGDNPCTHTMIITKTKLWLSALVSKGRVQVQWVLWVVIAGCGAKCVPNVGTWNMGFPWKILWSVNIVNVIVCWVPSECQALNWYFTFIHSLIHLTETYLSAFCMSRCCFNSIIPNTFSNLSV